MDILIEEFGSDHATYHEILAAMAIGQASKKEISDMTHIEATSLSPYLYDLKDILGVVERVVPVTDDPLRSKKTRYFLKSNYFRFHFRFLYRNMSDYQIGNFDRIGKLVRDEWKTYRGRLFEDAALDHMRKSMSEVYPGIGKYWDRKGNELDIVGMDRNGNVRMVMEVKAREMKKKEAKRILADLDRKVKSIFGEDLNVDLGIAAIRLEGKESLRKERFSCYDLEDMLS
jgi:hypothetical protein